MRSVEESGNRLAKQQAKLADQTVNLVGESGPRIPARAPTAGETFADRYEILEKLGEGGVGAVYKARHLHLDTILAIKILQSSHLKDQDSVARFNREGKLISKLNHTNVVKVQEFGVYDGCPYMTMELIDGVPVSKLIGSANTSTDTWISIFRQVLDALAHAHERGIVHRDIKPGNILCKFDEDGSPVATVVDFGLAKVIDSETQIADSEALTRTGDLFGTPLYMSPEQCQGGQIDSRSDIYSLGCVMYHCLTGAPPFQGQSSFELVYRQINCSPATFSAKLRRRGIGPKLEAIVLKAMAKGRSARYQYAQKMSIDLLDAQTSKQGFLSELSSGLQLLTGRFKASERATMFRTTALIVTTINAVVTAGFLFFLPPQMEKENLLMNKYANFIWRLQQIAHSNILYPENRKEAMAQLIKLTSVASEDKELHSMAVKHKELVRIALAETAASVLEARSQIGDDPTLLLSNGLRIISKPTDRWMDCSASNARLTAKTSDLLNRNYDSLRWKYMLYSVLPTYGAASCLILVWLIGQNLMARLQENRRLKTQADGHNVLLITDNSI